MARLTIKRPERTVDLCTDAALQADWEQAERDLNEARRKQPVGMVGNADATRLAEKVRALEEAMHDSVVHFRLRALPRSVWAQIFARHPLTDDAGDADKRFGGMMAPFFEDVLAYVDDDAPDVRSIVAVTDHAGDPVEFDPATEWTPLADEMTDRQYAAFSDAVFMLNRGEVSVPFSKAASRTHRPSSESSERPGS